MNPIYCGKIKHKTDLYLRQHQAIVDEEIFERVQAQLRSDVESTVVEVVNSYRKFAEQYYRKNGEATREYGCIKEALSLVHAWRIFSCGVPWPFWLDGRGVAVGGSKPGGMPKSDARRNTDLPGRCYNNQMKQQGGNGAN